MAQTNDVNFDDVNVKGKIIEWNIKDFSSLLQFKISNLHIAFFFCKEMWEIKLYRFGQFKPKFMPLSVECRATDTKQEWILTSAVFMIKDKVVAESKIEKSTSTGRCYLFHEFLFWTNDISLWKPSDSYKVVCLFSPARFSYSAVDKVNVEPKTNQSLFDMQSSNRQLTMAVEETKADINNGSINMLSKDIQKLYINHELCDVKIKVGPKEFLAHRAILAARSSVFSSMFKHELIEKINGVIDISDCDPENFEDFLKFLYSGKIESIEADYRNLYRIADKYSVDCLKNVCVDRMSEKLEVETICDVLDLASMHNETQLLEKATTFFIKNAKCIIATEQWKKLVVEKTSIFSEILIKLLEKTQLNE